MTYIIFWLTLTLILSLSQEPYENIEYMKYFCKLFLKVLKDYKVYSAYLILNFESAFPELLKLFKIIFFKYKIKFTFLKISTIFSAEIANSTAKELNL